MKLFIKALSAAAVVLAVASCGKSINPDRVFTNPIDVDYAFTHQHQAGGREAADPVVALFDGKYYLFVSMSYGYWSSDDMKDWKFITNDYMHFGDYAPAVMVYNGELYWNVSGRNQLYKTSTPEDGDSWVLASENISPFMDEPDRTIWDPYLFADDDGRVYLYWGCSDVAPIMGAELDPANGFKAKTKPAVLIEHNEKIYGWECRGDKNETGKPSSNEGSAMAKRDGKYYLQYAGPGTEFDSYGDGVYVGDAPLGPFTHCSESPFSVKPGGWMTGAGHGDTFQDKYGNWWHVSSTVISQRFLFERRIGFYPVIFTTDGNMHALTGLTDWPCVLPDSKVDWTKTPFWTGWMDLTIGKSATASSEKPGHGASLACDNSIKTWWSSASGDPGEWLSVDLGKTCRVNAVQTNFADEDFGMFEAEKGKSPYRYMVEASKDGKKWKVIFDKSDASDTRPHELLVLRKPVKARYVRLSNTDNLTGKLSIHDLRVFGKAPGKAPAAVGNISVKRAEDRRRIEISWPKAEGADGYFVHWGTSPDEILSSCMTLEPSLELGLFSVDEEYWFKVDAFNGRGLTPGAEVATTAKM